MWRTRVSQYIATFPTLFMQGLCGRVWGETYLVGFLRGALGGGGGGRGWQPALPLPVSIPVDQLAVGFFQGPLELIDAGLVLQ